MQEVEIEGVFERAHRRWPEIGLTLASLRARVGELQVSGELLAAHGEDLFLAIACAQADPAALRTFDALCLRQIDSFVKRVGLPPHLVDEVQQKVAMKLFVGPTPGIRGYVGRGPLPAFVRVTAVRVAMDVAKASGSVMEHTESQTFESYVATEEDPELTTLKSMYGDRLKVALDETFAALPSADKTLLRLHLIDRLNVDELSTIYRSHRATIARRLVRIRTQLREALCGRFAMRLGASTSEVRSLVRLLADDIHLSAERVLASGA